MTREPAETSGILAIEPRDDGWERLRGAIAEAFGYSDVTHAASLVDGLCHLGRGRTCNAIVIAEGFAAGEVAAFVAAARATPGGRDAVFLRIAGDSSPADPPLFCADGYQFDICPPP